MRPLLVLLVGCLVAAPGVAAESDLTPGTGPKWCPPDGPRLPNRLSEGQHSLLKPGWVTLRMHVQPGAVPVRDVRVVSEAGGPMHARTLIPLVRQWIGCASNERDTIVDMKFAFWLEGSSQLPQKEGFSPLAFKEPRGAPQLPAGDWGIGVCPIRATLLLRQPEAPNVVNEIESGGGAPVRAWLESLVPDREYMTPSPTGNRVEFDCRVDGAKVTFSER
jgi:hypothetical protein